MKVGVYVDVANLGMNGGFGMRYDVLRAFACRNGYEAMRLNAYVSFDDARARHDPEYKSKQYGFHSVLRDLGYKVIQKEVKWPEAIHPHTGGGCMGDGQHIGPPLNGS
jgi:hypothetical protein